MGIGPEGFNFNLTKPEQFDYRLRPDSARFDAASSSNCGICSDRLRLVGLASVLPADAVERATQIADNAGIANRKYRRLERLNCAAPNGGLLHVAVRAGPGPTCVLQART